MKINVNTAKHIIHVGVGNFHRAHQAYCLNKLINMYPIHKAWKITGVHMLPSDKPIWNTLKNNKYEYMLLEKDETVNNKTIIKSITDSIYLPRQTEIQKLMNMNTNELKWVTMTLTEKGYHKKNRQLDITKKEIQNDLVYANLYLQSTLEEPRIFMPLTTIYGLLFKILYKRYSKRLNGISILSCDNINNNSKTLCELFIEFVKNLRISHHDKNEFIEWVKNANTFPNTMVDRITPTQVIQYTEKNNDDNNSYQEIITEPYFKWVIEHDFVSKSGMKIEHPPLENVNILWCKRDEIQIHERMKLELLNGTHALIAYLSFMYNYKTVKETLSKQNCRIQIENYQHAVMKLYTIEEIQTFKIIEYAEEILKRFNNPYINDNVERLRVDGGHKLKHIYEHIFNKNSNLNHPNILELFYSLDPYLSQTIHYYLHYVNNSNMNEIKTDYVGYKIKKEEKQKGTLEDKLRMIFN